MVEAWKESVAMKKVALLDLGKPLNAASAIKRIRTLWRLGNYTWTRHAQERLCERGLDTADVETVILDGRVVEISRPGTEWRYKVEGRTVEGRYAACVVEMRGNLLTVVTVMLSRRR